MARRILVPLDGSPGAEAIVDVLVGLGLAANATLVLLHTVMPTLLPPPRPPGPMPMIGPGVVPEDLYERERDRSRHDLADVRARLAARGLQCEATVREGAPAETIAAVRDEFGADLVAMATHARSGLGRLLLGSVADAVVRQASVPVLVVRTDDADDAEDDADAAGGV